MLTERPLRAPEIRAIHPFGKMPVLRHGDFQLFESKAIASYLDRSFPAPYVFPANPELAALTEQWVSLVNTLVDQTLIRTYLFAYIAPKTANGEPDRKTIEAVMPALREQRSSRHGGCENWLSCRRSSHLCRHQPLADPSSDSASAGRRNGTCRHHASGSLL